MRFAFPVARAGAAAFSNSRSSSSALRVIVGVLVSLTTAGLLAAGPAAEPAPAASAKAVDFVGATTGIARAPYIGISVRGDHVIAYVCDGDEKRNRQQTVYAWFRGKAKAGEINLRSVSGARLRARLEGDRVTGSVLLADGRELSFTAKRVKGKARFLFASKLTAEDARRREPVRNGKLVLGWIRLADGSERGTNEDATAATCSELRGVIKYQTLKYKGGTLPLNQVDDYVYHVAFYVAHC